MSEDSALERLENKGDFLKLLLLYCGSPNFWQILLSSYSVLRGGDCLYLAAEKPVSLPQEVPDNLNAS